MAELLIYNKIHWRDVDNAQEIWQQKILNDVELNSAQKAKSLQIHQDKYNSRYQKGDIIEIHEDGFWTKDRKGWGYSDFVLVVVPGVSEASIKYMTMALDDGSKIVYKSKYQVDMSQFVIDSGKIEVSNMNDAKIITKII